MAIPSCNADVINKNHCSVNYSPSRVRCPAAAFVLHQIPQFTAAEYLNFSKTKYGMGRTYYTEYPKSVHFLIDEAGTVYQLVETTDRAWGVTTLQDPSWRGLNTCSWTDFEDLFIHIGLIGVAPTRQQTDMAAYVICCYIVNNAGSQSMETIVARDLDTRLDKLWSVPETIVAKSQVCIQNNGVDPYDNTSTVAYNSRLDELEAWRVETVDPKLLELVECCCDLRDRVDSLEEAVEAIQATVDNINIDDLLQRLTDLEAGNLNIWKAIRVIQNCLDCAHICVPETPVSIKYRLDLSDAAKLVPGAMQHLNLPIKINDTDPPIVTTGPLWYAELTAEAQTLCTTFKIKASVRLAAADWCAGRILELYAVINSENILLNKYTAEAGSQSAAVYGETIFAVPPDTTIYLAVKTDEDTSPLEIVAAQIEIICLDGLLSPNCTECDTV